MKRVTALDVARAAGVSKTTVSFVINETPGHAISDETRQRVLAAVVQLGYVPNPVAQALRRGHNDLVLFVLPDLPLASVLARAVDAMATGLAERGLSLLVRRPLPGQSLSELWRGLSPAAVVTVGAMEDACETEIRSAGIVVTAVLLGSPADLTSAVVISQEHIGQIQVEHLAARGCRRVAYAAPSEPRLLAVAEPRIAGARRACADLGLPELDVQYTELHTGKLMQAVDGWSRADGPRTGVAAYNDEFGSAVLAALARLGRRAPDDLAVIGCDDETMSAFSSPPMTTIDQQPELAGARLAAITADELRSRGESVVTECIVLTLVPRQTT